MDNKLKKAIAAVRSGDREAAQQQLTTLLEEKPEEAQGWYLLSLIVDSPQKQAAYLSKTLALSPNHPKAKAQLATLQQDGRIAPTSNIAKTSAEPIDVITQADSDTLPAWLQEEGGLDQAPAPAAAELTETAVPNETLPEWLKEPAALTEIPAMAPVEESPTVVGPTAQTSDEADKAVTTLRQQTAKQPAKKRTKTSHKNTASLNIILGVLILLALMVMVALAYLILS